MSSDLVEELLARTDDLELRRVIADRLQEEGDPRGELMAVQCALADAAATPEERERLSAREGELLERVSLGIDPAALELEWRLGFVLAAIMLDGARELVPALLAHPAVRLIEELTIAVEPEDLAEIGAVLAARPRPSRLRWVAAGPPAPGRRWVALADAAWVAPLVAAAPDLDVRSMGHVMQALYEADLEGDMEEHRSELWTSQIAPRPASFGVELPVRRGSEAAMAEVRAALGEGVQRTLVHDPEQRLLRIQHGDVPTYLSYANLYRALRALAPFIEDSRFSISEDAATSVDELAIVHGKLRFLRGFAQDESWDAKREYWYRRHLDRPHDDDLRRFVAELYVTVAHADFVEQRIPSGDDPDGRCDGVRRAITRALALDDRNPDAWHFRGRVARAAGDLDEATRCFEREAALDPSRASSVDLAITMFAARRDAAAREHLERRIAAVPTHLDARAIAAYLAHGAGAPDASRAHVAALNRDHAPWEAHKVPIVQSGRHTELLAWLVAALSELGRADAAMRPSAASYLLDWAVHFQRRIEDGWAPEGSARIAEDLFTAAADLDPLDGEVHYRWSRLDRSTGPRRLGRANLERALAINPDHPEAVADLGIVHLELGEHARAIVLLEHYRAVSLTPGKERPDYDRFNFLGHLWRAYHEHAAQLMFGVPPGANRPPGRPSDAALAQAEASLDRALDVLRERGVAHEGAEDIASYVLKSAIAAFRDQHREALAWADRALAVDDESPPAWAARASCQRGLGMLDDAAACAQRAIQLDTAQWQGHYVLACVEAKRGGNPDAILRPLARALALWPEGRPEAAEEPDLAPVRELPAFRALVGGGAA